MQIGQAIALEQLGHGRGRRCRVGIAAVVVAGEWRNTHADAVGADFGDHRLDHFAQKAQAVFHAAAIQIAALVGARREELVRQIAVGGMDLDPVEPGPDSVRRALCIVGNRFLDFSQGHRTRWRCREAGITAVGHLTVDLQRVEVVVDFGRPQRRLAIEDRVGADPAAMPELHEDMATLGMDGVSHLAPALDLRLAVDARRLLESAGLGGDVGALGNEQPGRSALTVISRADRQRHVTGTGAAAGQGRHHDAIG